MERMTQQDYDIFALEDDIVAAHGLTVAVFDGPEPAFDDVLDLVADRVRLVPRYRQRLVEVPFSIERPVWVDDPTFSIDFHVRHTALPKRTSRDPLNAFISRALSQRLDRGKPLWELWLVSGLPKNQWALVSKAHYAIIDGVSGTDILGLLADNIEVPPGMGQSMLRPLPNDRQLLLDAATDLLFDPVESFRAVRGITSHPFRVAKRLTAGLRTPVDPNGLGRAVGPHRKWRSAKVPLDDLREVRTAHDCSTTDAILASIGTGIRRYLVETGKPVPATISVVVPLSVGAASGGLSGQVTTLTATLPIGLTNAAERLRRIHEQTSTGARETGALAGRILRRQENFVAPTILAQGVRSTMLDTRTQRMPDTVTINVPGPAETISVLGYPMVETYPVIPLPGGVQIAVAAMSLENTVYFGITSDFDSTKGLEHLSDGISRAVTELLT